MIALLLSAAAQAADVMTLERTSGVALSIEKGSTQVEIAFVDRSTDKFLVDINVGAGLDDDGEAAPVFAGTSIGTALEARALFAYRPAGDALDGDPTAPPGPAPRDADLVVGLELEGKVQPGEVVQPDDVEADPTGVLAWAGKAGLRIQDAPNQRMTWAARAGVSMEHSLDTTDIEVCTPVTATTATANACEDRTVLDAAATTFGAYGELRLNYLLDNSKTVAPGLELRAAVDAGFGDDVSVEVKPGLFGYLVDLDLPNRPRAGIGADLPIDVLDPSAPGIEIAVVFGVDL